MPPITGAPWQRGVASAADRLPYLLLLWAWLASAGAEAARCFCDKRNCADALMCDGRWCLVGFKSDVRLDQMCAGDEADGLDECKQNWNGWVEVCACNDDFCNTFNHLRTQMERFRSPDATLFPPGSGGTAQEVSDPESRRLPPYQSNQLIVLLVVVPLAVGAAAVCLVFLNYHCKM